MVYCEPATFLQVNRKDLVHTRDTTTMTSTASSVSSSPHIFLAQQGINEFIPTIYNTLQVKGLNLHASLNGMSLFKIVVQPKITTLPVDHNCWCFADYQVYQDGTIAITSHCGSGLHGSAIYQYTHSANLVF